jgi:hypothetical protein
MAKRMNWRGSSLFYVVAVSSGAIPIQADARPFADQLCAPLKAFVASVKPGKTQTLEFETAWFTHLTGSADTGVIGKSCDHHGYNPARVACASLLKYSSTEFAGLNAMRVIMCLSPGTHFAPFAQLDQIALDFSYGYSNRGQNVSVKLGKAAAADDPRVMKLEVEGY